MRGMAESRCLKESDTFKLPLCQSRCQSDSTGPGRRRGDRPIMMAAPGQLSLGHCVGGTITGEGPVTLGTVMQRSLSRSESKVRVVAAAVSEPARGQSRCRL